MKAFSNMPNSSPQAFGDLLPIGFFQPEKADLAEIHRDTA